jgi:phosphatidylserine decarboxylase
VADGNTSPTLAQTLHEGFKQAPTWKQHVAKSLSEWIASDVDAGRKLPMRALSESFFFRDPVRPQYTDTNYFFSPADGVILYQRIVAADEPLVEIKGRDYSLQQALRNKHFDKKCLVIGIFMTTYDVHINRIPYPGTLTFEALQPLHTLNRPMLELEEDLIRGHGFSASAADYLFGNQRTLNTIHAAALGLEYHVLQIADYDVSAILTFDLRQPRPVFQNQRFSQIRFGSQVDLVVPLSERFRFETLVPDNWHVEAGVDALIRICPQA